MSGIKFMLTTQALLQRQLPVNAGPNLEKTLVLLSGLASTNEVLTKIYFAVKPL